MERWQEFVCPNSGIDFDLEGSEMVSEGDSFYCSGCWSQHIAAQSFIQQYEREGDDTRCVPLQKRATA